jgi:hypothetical protein
MADKNLEDRMVSNIPRSVLAIGGSLLCLSLSLNLVGVYLGPAINDWMKFKIEHARQNGNCEVEASKKVAVFEKRIDLLQKRFDRVEKLAHRKTE